MMQQTSNGGNFFLSLFRRLSKQVKNTPLIITKSLIPGLVCGNST